MFRTTVVFNKSTTAAKALTGSCSGIHTWTHQKMWKPVNQPQVGSSKRAQERFAKKLEGKTLTAEQFARTRKPFDMPVITKKPIHVRPLKRKRLVAKLEEEEFYKLRQIPREVCKFVPGDKVAITNLISLTEDKSNVYKGHITDIQNGRTYHGRFTIRNQVNGTFYTINIPYWSPFIRIIEALEKEPKPRRGTKQLHWIRKRPADDPLHQPL